MVYRYYVTLPWWKSGFNSRYPLQNNNARIERRGSQVVRQGSAKPLYAGSIPAHASTNIIMLYLQILHVVITLLLGTSILLQQRGSGLGDAFGADTAVYTSRRGVEKLLFYLTIIFGISFIVLSLLQLILNK
jgi:preprotein translocase subunit SecG